jgi:hypothetical protein
VTGVCGPVLGGFSGDDGMLAPVPGRADPKSSRSSQSIYCDDVATPDDPVGMPPSILDLRSSEARGEAAISRSDLRGCTLPDDRLDCRGRRLDPRGPTGDRLAPAYYLAAFSLVGTVASLLMPETRGRDLDAQTAAISRSDLRGCTLPDDRLDCRGRRLDPRGPAMPRRCVTRASPEKFPIVAVNILRRCGHAG